MTKLVEMLLLAAMSTSAAAESISLSSETGDNLMLHKLHSESLWATFQITDQVVESFALQELIVLQVDQNKPVKLQQGKKVCGAPAPAKKQTLSYAFEPTQSSDEWAFSTVTVAKQDVLKVFAWDSKAYDMVKADRRSEFVDFPLQAMAAGDMDLWQQFEQGETVVFRYITEAGEARQASFALAGLHLKMASLKK